MQQLINGDIMISDPTPNTLAARKRQMLDSHRRQALNNLWSNVNAQMGGAVAQNNYVCRYIDMATKRAPFRAYANDWDAYVEWFRDGLMERARHSNLSTYQLNRLVNQSNLTKRKP